eukprot:2904316-Alexandrium_andersonii.AAC.1
MCVSGHWKHCVGPCHIIFKTLRPEGKRSASGGTHTRTHNTTTLASSATSHSGTWLEKAGMQQRMVRTFANAGVGRAGRCGARALTTHPFAN